MDWEELLNKLKQYKDGAVITGEMSMAGLALESDVKVDDIPVSSSVDYDKLIEGDEEPMEVAVSMQAGKSKRGWDYTPEVVKSIVDQVNSDSPNGFKGHQKAENVSHEFVDPATHWIGAKYDDKTNTAYFRGYVDPSEKKLRRWIKTKRINETSIFGEMQLKKEKGETKVVGCNLMSIDWTPKGRPGMQTKVVDIKGEMDEGGNSDMTKEELIAALRTFLASNKGATRELVGEMDANFIQEVENLEAQLPQVRQELGLKEDATFEEVIASIKNLKKIEADQENANQKRVVDEVIKEKFPENQEAQALAGEMFVPTKTEKKEIAGEMDALLEKPSIKKMFDNLMTDNVTNHRSNNRNSSRQFTSVRVKRNRLN